MHIEKSKKYEDGVTVWFKNQNGYYAHGIIDIGSPEDGPERMDTMWAWVHHLRPKLWWQPEMEVEFKSEVAKYF
jgi:hypothetical protein